MTLQGAIQELHDMRGDDNFPFYYKPAIDKVIETILMDAQEVRHGRWDGDSCSVCGFSWCDVTYDAPQMQMPYCPNCGSRMDLEDEVDE